MNKGFTLIELLITLSIFSILIALPIFGFGSVEKSSSLNNAAHLVAAKLNMIRQKAISSSALTELYCTSNFLKVRKLNIATNLFEDINTESLPQGIVLNNDITFRFSSSGFPQPGYLGTAVLKDARGHTKKIIVSSAGRVRIE